MNSKFILMVLFTCLIACNSSNEKIAVNSQLDGANSDAPTTIVENSGIPKLTSENKDVPNNREVDDFKILFFGNSHSTQIPELVNIILDAAMPHKDVSIKAGQGIAFLDERLKDSVSLETLQSNDWTHVILQAQKYSQSGNYNYSTKETQIWIQLAKAQGATPILFPEHPQSGDTSEGRKVYELHTSISKVQSSCVAPVGLTWDEVILLKPELVLHRNDGNHASYLGAFLTSLVIYEAITGKTADELPYIEGISIDEETQKLFKDVTTLTHVANPSCEF